MFCMLLSFLAVLLYAQQVFCAPSRLQDSLSLVRRNEAARRDGQGETSPASLNALMPQNFPDPAIIETAGTYYTFSTSSGGLNVPIASSGDMTSMAPLKNTDGTSLDAMPSLPAWTDSTEPRVWAPDVIQLASGSFVLYYSATSINDTSKHCVGAATSPTVSGPFSPIDNELACPLKDGGAIDPAGFTDADGKVYVVYKVDGNSLGGGGPCGNADQSHDTPIMLQQVSATDGYTPIGTPTPLLHLGPADGPLIEAPSLVRSAGGTYVLFFSSNCYSTQYYDTSYATSTNVAGPYTKASAPLLATGTEGLLSPGGTDVLVDGSRIVFHADVNPSDATTRRLYTSKIQISGTTVSLTAD